MSKGTSPLDPSGHTEILPRRMSAVWTGGPADAEGRLEGEVRKGRCSEDKLFTSKSLQPSSLLFLTTATY